MCLVLQAYELHLKRIVLDVLLGDLAFSTYFSVLEAHPCWRTKFCFIRLYCSVFPLCEYSTADLASLVWMARGLLPGFASVATLLECLLCDFSDGFENIWLGPAFLGERICTSLPGHQKLFLKIIASVSTSYPLHKQSTSIASPTLHHLIDFLLHLFSSSLSHQFWADDHWMLILDSHLPPKVLIHTVSALLNNSSWFSSGNRSKMQLTEHSFACELYTIFCLSSVKTAENSGATVLRFFFSPLLPSWLILKLWWFYFPSTSEKSVPFLPHASDIVMLLF